MLAAGGFIPALGLFLGAAAATWGLVSSRPRALLAAMIGGAGALLNLAGGVAMAWRMERTPRFAAARALTTRRDLARLVGELEQYRGANGGYPRRLEVFNELPLSLKLVNIQDNSASVFGVPHTYQYRLAPDGRTYALFGVGTDRKPGTTDDVFPSLPDSVARRSGYRAPD